jgi:pyridoxal 5'-phosphate synthase pdxT subunit
MKICIGVLALQGDFAKHIEMLTSLQVATQEVRQAKDLEKCDGLIIPGGESTVIQRQLDFSGLREPLIQFANKKPLFGTCAGLILMSKQIQESSVNSLNLLDISTERNAFGRQAHSFEALVSLYLISDSQPTLFPAFFIRAPRIRATGSQVQILGTWQNEAVCVRQGHLLASSFHPELTKDPAIHCYFVQMVKELKLKG